VQVVADANVLVAAAATPDGTCGRLFRALLDGPVQLVVCPRLLEEVEAVLGRPRFAHVGTPLRRAFLTLAGHVALLEDDPAPAAVIPWLEDPGDAYLVRLTLAAPDRVLVTGDRHLLDHADVFPAVAPADLLGRLKRLRERP
jgi:predicted nucleic acid-binding protein